MARSDQTFRQEVNLTDGRVIVRGTLAARSRIPGAKGGPKRADYILYAQPHLPIAVIEAKQARYPVGHGMHQALSYAEMLDAPFALSSNGGGFLLHDRTGLTQPVERELPLNAFPSFEELWRLYQEWKGLSDPGVLRLVQQPLYTGGTCREPRYYQSVAINRAVEATAKGQQTNLLFQRVKSLATHGLLASMGRITADHAEIPGKDGGRASTILLPVIQVLLGHAGVPSK